MAEKDYISREAAIAEQKRFCGYLDNDMLNRLEIATRRIPAADVRPVVRGKWEEWWPGDCALIITGEEMLWMCSKCTAKFSDRSAYCPNCWAKMEKS